MNIVINKEAMERCGFVLVCVFMHRQTITGDSEEKDLFS